MESTPMPRRTAEISGRAEAQVVLRRIPAAPNLVYG
jgi:hypothetical protein